MEEFYNVTQFSKLINVKVKTLQKWDRTGVLVAKRTPTNRRYYTHNQYLEYIGETPKDKIKDNVIYARVSTRNQKDDLENQIEFISSYCRKNGIPIQKIYFDYGSGLNYKRKKWNELIDDCIDGKIDTIVISYKDRFTRFGFDWFSSFLSTRFNVKIVILNDIVTSPENEMIQDLISIIHVFSCRIYGLRKYKSKIKKTFEIEGDDNDNV